MKLYTGCLILAFANMVVSAPIRARRENVLNFLTDALATATKKTTPANTPAACTSRPVKEQDSEETSEAKSTESRDTHGFKDAFKDPDSHEVVITEVVGKDQAPSKTNAEVEKNPASREPVRPPGSHQVSGERTDLNSDEETLVDVQSGKRGAGLTEEQRSDSTDLQRKSTSRRVTGPGGVVAPGPSREQLDPDSLENNNGRPAAAGNRGDRDYDETREFISAETYPIAPPVHMSSSSSVPLKSQTS